MPNGVESVKLANSLPGKVYSGRLVIDFLKNDDLTKIRKLKNELDSRLGQVFKGDEINNLINETFKDDRFTPFVRRGVELLYEFQEVELPDLAVDEDTVKRFGTIWELKKTFYIWLQQNFFGYLPLGFRDVAIKRFAKSSKIRPELLDLILGFGNQKLIKLNKRVEFDPSILLGLTNYYILTKTLLYTRDIMLVVESNSLGKIVKELIYRSKRVGVFTDVKITNNKAKAYIERPEETLQISSDRSFGLKVAYVILPTLNESEFWEITATLMDDTNEIFFKMRSDSPWAPILTFPWDLDPRQIPKSNFDSLLEEKIYEVLSRMYGYVDREKHVIVLDDESILIPDFSILYEGNEIHIEVIGYWSERYLKKKMEKLNMLPNKFKNKFILLVDKKLKNYFTSNLPIVYISSKGIFNESELKRKVDNLIQ